MDDDRRAALEAVAFGRDSDADAAADARRRLAETDRAPERAPSPGPEHGSEAPVPDPDPGADPGQGADPEDRPDAHARRRAPLIPLLVGTALLAAALGVGGTVLTQHVAMTEPVAASTTAAGQSIRMLLAGTATNADLLPTTMHADVDRTTSRLVFENYPDVPPVPWRVWIALDRAGTSVCFVSTPDGYASDVTCASRAQALTGTVSFVTEDGGEGVAVHDVHGVVRVDLIGAN